MVNSNDIRRILADYFPLWIVCGIILFVFMLIAFTGKVTKPDQCTFPAGIACTSFYATNSTLKLSVSNGFDIPFIITNIRNKKGKCELNGTTIQSGKSTEFEFEGCQHPKPGRKLVSTIIIDYEVNENKTKSMSGSLIATIK